MLKRLGLTLINIFFPPLAVAILTGLGPDTLLNSALFLLAVIPSHVHGFYISLTYFGRKSKVRKGQDPGPWRRGIYSEKVQYGGASKAEVRRIRERQKRAGSGSGLGSKVGNLVRRVSGSGNGNGNAMPVSPAQSRTEWRGSQNRRVHKRRSGAGGLMGRIRSDASSSSESDSGSDYQSSRFGSRRVGNRLSGSTNGGVPMRQTSQRARY